MGVAFLRGRETEEVIIYQNLANEKTSNKKDINMSNLKPLRIGIIGAGYSGTALAATLFRLSDKPLEIILCGTPDEVAMGKAYSTPYPFHLLNVRAEEMSAFEDLPHHFLDWLNQSSFKALLSTDEPVANQYVPRLIYGEYLNSLLQTLEEQTCEHFKWHLVKEEVIDITVNEKTLTLVFSANNNREVDKVVLAMGNQLPVAFPFPVRSQSVIANPWDYTAITRIPKDHPVLIVGTGLSMIDIVQTLYHHGHEGVIHAISRHGLLPLSHSEQHLHKHKEDLILQGPLRQLMREVRNTILSYMDSGKDWRLFINHMRHNAASVWQNLSNKDKKRFLRHVLPYWNIHRHRVHNKIDGLLKKLIQEKKLTINAGRVLKVEEEFAIIQKRHSQENLKVAVKTVVNCLGPNMNFSKQGNPLIHSLLKKEVGRLDDLQLGFYISPECALIDNGGTPSSRFYALGPITRGTYWETSAVPDIRKQCFALAKQLLV